MAVNKNFVVKNGLEVNSQLIFADATNNKVGIATTQPNVELDVRGGIAATNTTVSGVSTIQTGLRVGSGIAGTIFTALDDNVVGVGTSIPMFLLDVRDPTAGAGGTVFNVFGDSLLDHTTVDSLRVIGISTYDDYAHFKNGFEVTAGVSTFATVLDINADVDISESVVIDGGITASGIGTIGNLLITPIGTGATVGNGLGIVTFFGDGSGLTNLNIGDITTISANSSSDALKVTQIGSGNALVVEDSANDTTPFVIDSNGKVGIGTNIPTHNLSLYDASFQISNSVEGPGSFKGLSFSYEPALDGNYIFSWTKNLTLTSGASADIIIQPAGNAGIGTNAPTQKLDVNGNLRVRGGLYVDTGGSLDVDGTDHDINGAIELDHVNVSGIVTATSFVGDITITESQISDFGTYATTASLATVATSGSYNDLSGKPTIPTNNNQLTNGAGYITSADGGNAATLDSLDSTSFLRSDAESEKTSGTLRLDDNVILSLGTGDDAELFCDGSHFYLDLNLDIGNFYIRDGNTTRFTFDDAGDFTASGNITATGNITASSDINLKENIEVIPNALNKVTSVRGVTYDRKDKGGLRQTGVIAQEIEAILPEAVMTDEEGIKSVAYGNMIGLLIEAIKEQQKLIDKLMENQK